MVQIKQTKSGNCKCYNCGKLQEGMKMHPFTVWHKAENEKRGKNDPVCSIECARKQAEKYQ